MAEEKASAKKEELVHYTGHADQRTLSVKEWGGIGIAGDKVKDVVWNKSNDFSVPKSEFSKEQLKYLLEDDGRFELV